MTTKNVAYQMVRVFWNMACLIHGVLLPSLGHSAEQKRPGDSDSTAVRTSWVQEGKIPDSGFGGWISSAGDVNGDGFDDVLVSAPNEDENRGALYLFLGSREGLSHEPVWYRRGLEPGGLFGNTAAGVGDVNGDGFSDILVGAPYEKDGHLDRIGSAYLFYGGPNGPGMDYDWKYHGNWEQGEMGSNVQPAGDVNGDGFADVIVSSFHAYRAGLQIGRALVFYGSEKGLAAKPDWEKEGSQQSANFGQAATSAGDVNGDGYDDIVLGVQHQDGKFDDEGRAYLILGSKSGLSQEIAWEGAYGPEEKRATGSPAVQLYGNAVSGVGDVNGDGYADVLVAAYFAERDDSDEGMVFLYLGTPTGLTPRPVWHAEGNQILGTLGSSISGVGDANGDGFSDIVIGGALMDQTELNEGGAFVYYGSTAGLNAIPDWSASGGVSQARLGRNVSRAGDVNRDGYDDVLVSTPYHMSHGNRVGQVRLYYGGPHGFGDSTGWTLQKSLSREWMSSINNLFSKHGWIFAIGIVLLIGGAAYATYVYRGRSIQMARAHTQSLIEQRHQLARDLHDDLGARLTRLAVISETIGQGDGGGTARVLAESTREVMLEMQKLVWAVNPNNDTLESLAHFLSSYCVRYFENSSIVSQQRIPLEIPNITMTSEVRKHLVLTVTEAMANVLKHSQATRVLLSLDCIHDCLCIEIEDDGAGFDVSPSGDAMRSPSGTFKGNGLGNMEMRMRAIGGRFCMHSSIGKGSKMQLEISLARLNGGVV